MAFNEHNQEIDITHSIETTLHFDRVRGNDSAPYMINDLNRDLVYAVLKLKLQDVLNHKAPKVIVHSISTFDTGMTAVEYSFIVKLIVSDLLGDLKIFDQIKTAVETVSEQDIRSIIKKTLEILK